MDDRRRFLSRAGLAGAAGVFSAVLTGAGPAQASPARARRVHGTWAMQITFPDTPGSSEQGIVAFTGSGAFTSTGTGTAYDPSGNLVAAQASQIQGTRY